MTFAMGAAMGAAVTGMLLVGLGLIAVGWRVLQGPSTADRAVATDMLGLIGICLAALTAVIADHAAFLDIAFGIAVFGFVGAVALAGLLERGSLGPGDAPGGAGE